MEKQLIENLPKNQTLQITTCSYILSKSDELAAMSHEISILVLSTQRKLLELKIHPETIKAKLADKAYFENKLNKAEIFERYNLLKHREIENEADAVQKKQAAENSLNELKATWTYDYFYRHIQKYFIAKHGEFILNEVNKLYVQSLCFFLSGNERFISDLNLDPMKGFLISGSTGLGKTEVIKAVKNNLILPIKIYSMLEITDYVKENGSFNLQTGSKIICLDDVGTEQPTVKHYGTEISWFKDFIENYYLNEKCFNGLIITTNLTGEQIEGNYGKRVRSRMREMFNVIALKGDDFRK